MSLPWTDDKPTPDVRVLSMLELVKLWRENRNSLLGVMAAEEIARRTEAETRGKR